MRPAVQVMHVVFIFCSGQLSPAFNFPGRNFAHEIYQEIFGEEVFREKMEQANKVTKFIDMVRVEGMCFAQPF